MTSDAGPVESDKTTVRISGWRDSPVVSVLDLGSEGPRFEPVGRGPGGRVANVGQLLFAPWAWAYSALHP